MSTAAKPIIAVIDNGICNLRSVTKALEAAGATVELLAPEAGEAQAFNHLDKADAFPVDKAVGDADASDYDALMLPGGVARFTFTCEHGPLEVDVNIASGKIGGFIGRSPGIAPPANVTKLFTTAVGLTFNPSWSTAAYKLVFPKQQIPEAQAREVSKGLRAEFGTCKPGQYTHEGFGWTLDLACAKGGPLALSIELDPHGDLQSILFHPPPGQERQRCATK